MKKAVRSKTKRVLVIEIDEESPEYDIFYRLINLTRKQMKEAGFSDNDYDTTTIIYQEVMSQRN